MLSTRFLPGSKLVPIKCGFFANASRTGKQVSPPQQAAHGRAPLLSPKCRAQPRRAHGRTGGCWTSEHPEGFGGFGDALEERM